MLIAMCGINGCGKSLQARLLQKHFQERDRQCLITKAYDEAAKATCRPLIETWGNEIATTFLLQALQSQQYVKTKRLLEEGAVVIADRWDESYLAHHENFGFLADRDELRTTLNLITFQGLLPDIGFLLDIPLTVAKERRGARGEAERFGHRPDAYYETIQRAYYKIAKERDWRVIDGTQAPEVIHGQVVDTLIDRELLSRSGGEAQ